MQPEILVSDVIEKIVREDVKILEEKLRWCRKNIRKGNPDERTKTLREGMISGLELALALVKNNPPTEKPDGER